MTPHRRLQQRTSAGTPWYDVLSAITGGYTITAADVLVGPRVVYRPIPESTTQPIIKPRSAILHTNAGKTSARSLWAYYTNPLVSGESHLQVSFDGVEQYLPFTRRADCNYSANRWRDGSTMWGAISFETQDLGAATVDTTPWSLQQLESMIATLTCLAVVYGIQCTQPATWNASGIGHHTLFPFQGIGRPAWTNVRGKTCPGRARIAQMDYIRRRVADNLGQFVQQTGWQCGTI